MPVVYPGGYVILAAEFWVKAPAGTQAGSSESDSYLELSIALIGQEGQKHMGLDKLNI